MTLVHSTSIIPHSVRLPPCILIHGAANSESVWTYWLETLSAKGSAAFAVSLRGHGRSVPYDLSRTSMNDYVNDICALANQLNQPPVLIGWSMGGLVALMTATKIPTAACIGLAPSTPASEIDFSIELRTGEFTSEEYGITSNNPEDQTVMPDLNTEERTIALSSLCKESVLARDERKRGIVIDSLACPLLIITGTLDEFWPKESYADLALPAKHLSVDGASHWGLVLNQQKVAELVPKVVEWIGKSMQKQSLLKGGSL